MKPKHSPNSPWRRGPKLQVQARAGELCTVRQSEENEMNPKGAMPAYPVNTGNEHVGHQTGANTWQFVGMSKREVFAMAAIQGLLASSSVWPDMRDGPEIARRSVAFGDALLAALATEPQQESV